MNDIISRQAAITAIQNAYCDTEGGEDKCAVWKNVGLTNALHIMQDLPSAQPEQQWIPCSERLPEDYQYFYATCRSNIDNRENWVIEGWYTPWIGFNPPPLVAEGKAEIIAWMPKEFPEPYREDDK